MKNSISKYWNVFTKVSPLIAVVFLVLWLQTCSSKNEEIDRHQQNNETLDSEIKEFKLKNGQLATEKSLLQVTTKELQNQVWIKDDSLQLLFEKVKNPKVTVKVETKIVFDTIRVPFEKPVDFAFSRTFNKNNPWYKISGTVDQNGVTLNPPLIPNTQRLVIGSKKGVPTVTITNSNPHIVTNEIEGQLIETRNKPWNLSAGVGWNGFQSPYVGIYLGRTIFRF
jgi:hypothetical protein